jgi:hypothetical protein
MIALLKTVVRVAVYSDQGKSNEMALATAADPY